MLPTLVWDAMDRLYHPPDIGRGHTKTLPRALDILTALGRALVTANGWLRRDRSGQDQVWVDWVFRQIDVTRPLAFARAMVGARGFAVPTRHCRIAHRPLGSVWLVRIMSAHGGAAVSDPQPHGPRCIAQDDLSRDDARRHELIDGEW